MPIFRTLFIVFFFFSYSFSQNTVLSNVPREDSTSFIFLGHYSNMHYSNDHQYGEDVYIWVLGDSLYGYMEYSLGGAMGDYTMSLLERMQYIPQSQKLLFEAKCPFYDEKRNVKHYMFFFDGIMEPAKIYGILDCRELDTENEYSRKEVTWKNKVTAQCNDGFGKKKLEEWKIRINKELKEHGARW